MPTKTFKLDPRITFAAQNARLGLISVADLSLLTGVATTQLTTFAKKGFVTHYGEYHGKRFFNFEEIVNWLNEADEQDEAKPVIWASMKEVLKDTDCPYKLEQTIEEKTGNTKTRIIWKEETTD